MLFRQVTAFEIPESFNPTVEDFEMAASKEPARPCQYQEREHLGFAEPFEGYNGRVYSMDAGQVVYLRLIQHERVLPAKVVRYYSEQRIRDAEQKAGGSLKKAEKRAIEDAVFGELVSNAPQKPTMIQMIADFQRRELWIDQTSDRRVEAALGVLRAGIGGSLPVRLPQVDDLPDKLKTWALEPQARPRGIEVGGSIKLSSVSDGVRSGVTVRHETIGEEEWVRIISTREVEELALESEDMTFTLTTKQQVKQIKSLYPAPEVDRDDKAGLFYAQLWETITSIRHARSALFGGQSSNGQRGNAFESYNQEAEQA